MGALQLELNNHWKIPGNLDHRVYLYVCARAF